MQHICCVCDNNTTQDVVCVKMQHTISGSESVASTQDVVMQFRNVVNISHRDKNVTLIIIVGIYTNYLESNLTYPYKVK